MTFQRGLRLLRLPVPQIIRGNMANWKITRFGHASKGRSDTRINNEIRNSLSRKRITVSLKYITKMI
jgi:hypothetical protein